MPMVARDFIRSKILSVICASILIAEMCFESDMICTWVESLLTHYLFF